MKLFAIIEEQNEQVQSILIREMLLRAAKEKNIEAEIRLHKSGAAAEIPAARRPGDILLYISGDKEASAIDKQSLEAGFHGPVLLAGREEALNQTAALWQKIEAAAGAAPASAAVSAGASGAAAGSDNAAGGAGGPVRHIVAVTSCPTGIAHTFMAAEALQEGAKALNIPIRVETQGSVGAGTPLTPEEIKQADLVIIAADREVDRSRFDGKRIYVSKTKPAISNGKAYIEQAICDARIQGAGAAAAAAAGGEAEEAESKGWFYPPLMNGVSFMLPFVVAGGLLIALSIAFGGMDGAKVPGTFAWYLNQIGAEGAFKLYIPVLAAYIAYAIGDRPALAPGMVGGYIAMNIGAGFIGGILAGFIAGYIAKYAAKWIRLPKAIAGLNPVLILPLICTGLTGLIMYYIIGHPVEWIMTGLANWLRALQSSSSAGSIASVLLLGGVVGGMMAVDVGGPVNKAAYTVSIGLLTMKIYSPMAAALIGGMVPPMALALATLLRPSCFTEKERDSRIATFIMGLAFVSEGAIPFATRNPLRVIPCLIIGSAVAGAVALGFGTGVTVPHGGIFLLLIKGTIIGSSGAPDAMGFLGYFAALIIGMIVSAILLCIVCRPVAQQQGGNVAPAKVAA